jgi:hypothetical protein
MILITIILFASIAGPRPAGKDWLLMVYETASDHRMDRDNNFPEMACLLKKRKHKSVMNIGFIPKHNSQRQCIDMPRSGGPRKYEMRQDFHE